MKTMKRSARSKSIRARANKIITAVLALATLGLAGCYSTPQQQACTPSPTFAYELFELVNQARANHGVQPVQWDQELADFGTWHSQRMAAAGGIYHSSPQDRIDFGVDGGENVAGGGSAACAETTATWMHASLMASPLHRDNLLAPHWTALGVGYAVGGDGRVYAAQEFGGIYG